MALLSAAMPTWKTLDDAATESGMSRRQLQRWLKDGRLKGYKLPGDRHVYVDMDALAKLRRYELIPPPSRPRAKRRP